MARHPAPQPPYCMRDRSTTGAPAPCPGTIWAPLCRLTRSSAAHGRRKNAPAGLFARQQGARISGLGRPSVGLLMCSSRSSVAVSLRVVVYYCRTYVKAVRGGGVKRGRGDVLWGATSRVGLWRIRFPPVLVRTGRRLPVQALGERGVWVTVTGYPRGGAPGP